MRNVAYVVISILLGTVGAVEARDLTIVYLSPDNRAESMFVVEEWPSFMFLAGAPLLVKYGRTPQIAFGMGLVSGTDLNCDQVGGPVYVGNYDPNNLDADNDGVGCE